jgi:uncharacterized protein (TIGR02270 family)
VGVYLEHLEEASFLYQQRLSLLQDRELGWRDLDDFEERFEAHVDALVLGEELALRICKQQVVHGDFGELHAAVRVFCREDRKGLVNAVIEALDPQDDERVKAVADALCHELPATWQRTVVERLTIRHPLFTRVAARALGYRRLPAAGELLEALRKAEEWAVPDLIWALGRLGVSSARTPLFTTYLGHESEAIRAAASVALLRIGETATLQVCAGLARSHPWALLSIGLGGSKSNLGLLSEIAASEAVSAECLLALGLLGEISAIEPLLYHLGEATYAEAASIALSLITGADLFEEVILLEEIDEQELFEDELEGERSYAAAETLVSRISQQPDVWREWWHRNQSRFKPGARYRNGRPYGPDCLLENLASRQSPGIVRRFASEELTIRYGCRVPLEADMFVERQIKALAEIAAWVDKNRDAFQPGQWYLAGRAYSW